MDKKFSAVKFNSTNGEPIRDAAFKRFANYDTFVTVLGLLADFYTMVNGCDSYHPFNIR